MVDDLPAPHGDGDPLEHDERFARVAKYARDGERSGFGSLRGEPLSFNDGPVEAFNAATWIVILFDKARGYVTGTNHYTDLVELFDAIDAASPGERVEVHPAAPLTAADHEAAIEYTAPAMQPPGELVHIVDDDEPDDYAARVSGWTACGIAMDYADRWIPVPTGDRVCPACAGDDSALGVFE